MLQASALTLTWCVVDLNGHRTEHIPFPEGVEALTLCVTDTDGTHVGGHTLLTGCRSICANRGGGHEPMHYESHFDLSSPLAMSRCLKLENGQHVGPSVAVTTFCQVQCRIDEEKDEHRELHF